MDNEKKDFFVSYTHSDEEWAKWIAWQLESDGHSVIIQAWDFVSGNFVAKIDGAIINCERFILVLSPEYFKAPYCIAESTAIITKDPSNEKSTFIPVKVKECKTEGLLAPDIYCTLCGLSEEKAIKKLLDTVHGKRLKSKPEFPGGECKSTSAVTPRPRFPGQMPFNNLPYPRNVHFTGRDEIIGGIRTAFESGENISLTQACKGMGGVGKTQTVLEYAYRYAHLYDTIWWVNAESSEQILKSLTEFAHRNNLVDQTVFEKDSILQAFRDWTSQHCRWLLIYDNAEDLKSLHEYLPIIKSGHTLITSRHPGWKQGAKEIEIDVFEPEEAVEFLMKTTGTDDKANAKELAVRLGCLPLALEQAAAYIITSGIDFGKYLKLFEINSIELFKKECDPLDYNATVATTWNISIEKIKKESAKQLLKICSFFAADNIDKSLFIECSDCLPEPLATDVKDNMQYTDIIAELAKYSLIKNQGDVFSIHRLLQEVIKQSLDQKEWLGYCTCIMYKAYIFDNQNTNSWLQFSNIIPHALSVASYAEKVLYPEEAARIFDHTGVWFEHTGTYSESELMIEKALEIKKMIFGKEHLKTINTYSNLAVVYKWRGEYKKAHKLLLEVLRTQEKVLGEEHADTVITRNNIASIYYDRGEYTKALEWIQKALDISEKTYGKNHLNTAYTYNLKALALYKLKEYDKALEWNKNALKIREEMLGTEHPDTAVSYNNIALIISDKGHYTEALKWLNKALEINENMLTKNHPSTASIYNNIAGIHFHLKDYKNALEWYQKACEIEEKVLGNMHLLTAPTYNNIAMVYCEKGEYRNSLEWYIKSYRVHLLKGMTDHPNAQTILKNLCSAYILSGRKAEDFDEWLKRQLEE